jgi:hypothetical protein
MVHIIERQLRSVVVGYHLPFFAAMALRMRSPEMRTASINETKRISVVLTSNLSAGLWGPQQ